MSEQKFNIADRMHEFIDFNFYFIIQTPRQTGKTSAIFQFITRLIKENAFTPLYVNVEQARLANNVNAGIEIILGLLKLRIKETYGPQDPALALFDSITENPLNALYDFLRKWAQVAPKPIVLFIDEIDSLVGDTLNSVLSQIRTGYLERPSAFPHSVCLISEKAISKTSFVNIKAESMLQ